MKKSAKVMAGLLAAALTLSMAGCTKKAAGSHERVVIKFPTATASGALYAVGAAISNMWDTNIDFVSASRDGAN